MDFKLWLEEHDKPHATIRVDGAEVGYDLDDNGTPIIVSFNGLKWNKKGVIEKTIQAVRDHSGSVRVRTDSGIRQHWKWAGYKGD